MLNDLSDWVSPENKSGTDTGTQAGKCSYVRSSTDSGHRRCGESTRRRCLGALLGRLLGNNLVSDFGISCGGKNSLLG